MRPRARRGANGQLLVRRSKKGLEQTTQALQWRSEERRAREKQERLAEYARKKARRLDSGEALWCEYQPNGCAGCGYFCLSNKHMAKHIAKAKHRTRRHGGHAVGTVVDSHSRIVLGAAAALQNATGAAGPTRPAGLGVAACVPADGFKVKLLSGREVELPPPKAGWACHKQLSATRPTAAMYE